MLKPESILSLLVFIAMIIACSERPGGSSAAAAPDFLELAWETDTVFITPESVLYDADYNRFYVSNVGQNPWRIDGDGFISVMDTAGKVSNLRWTIGLSGPKGMGISGDHLYVADIDRACRIDRETGAVEAEIIVGEGASAQLNDIAVDAHGTVYVSGSGSEAVYMLSAGRLVRVFGLDNEEIGRPNGLLWQDGRLYMAGSRSGRFSRVDMAGGALEPLADSLGVGDGIAPDGSGGYFLSDWDGRIFHIEPDADGFRRTLLVDWRGQSINAADLACLPDRKLLLVPTFFDNRVRAFRFGGR